MTRINFVDRNNIGGVIIKGGQPFLLLFFGPVALRWCDIIISFSRALFEWAWRVHRGKGRGAAILRRFFDLGSNVRRNRHQMMA